MFLPQVMSSENDAMISLLLLYRFLYNFHLPSSFLSELGSQITVSGELYLLFVTCHVGLRNISS